MENGNRNRIHIGVIIFIIAVLLWVAASRTAAADAAVTTDGTYYPDVLEVEDPYERYHGSVLALALDTCEYFFVTLHYDGIYSLCFIDDSFISDIGYLSTDSSGYVGFYCSYSFTVSYNDSKGKWEVGSIIGLVSGGSNFERINGPKESGFILIGTNFPLYQNYLQDTGGVELPQNNLFFPGSGGGDVPTTSVTLSVNGTMYTVDEPYPYYFVSYAYDSVRLFFTEEPFMAWWADLYTFNLYPGAQPVVCYHWSEEENNDFLSSRTTEALGLPYKHPASADYSSNYDVLSSKDSKVCLPEKPLYPDVVTLYSAFTDEMLDYEHCIILRQEHEDALTNDVVCYLWNDSAANLIIRWGDSRIAAAKKGTMVTDYLAARYDLKTGTWNIDKNTPISRCNNEVYNVPYIYYSTSDLYVQQPGQTGWYPSDMCVSAGSLEVPGFHPGIPTEPGFSTGIDWLDTLLDNLFGGLGKFFSRIFIPSSGYFERKVNALQQKFRFWESIKKTAEVFLNFFENTDFSEPPKITVNLSSATSKYDYGTSATFLDLSWYEPYKPSVDMLLSSIMWVVFAWNTFKNLPSIISGVSTAANVGAKALKEVKGGRDNDC